VAAPVAGKESDIIGRKAMFIASMALFLAASAACGLAGNMMALAVFRAVQGLGGALW
jgi:MFS family permease